MTSQSITPPGGAPAVLNPKSQLWSMVSIMLLAALFRFVASDAAPPGWRDDELIEFGMDQRIVAGWRPLFIAEAEGHEPFYHYLHAGTIALFGANIAGYKWLPFAFGVITVALTYALARRMFDARIGLLAAALMAVSFWPIMYARFGLRHIGVLPLMLGALWLQYPPRVTRASLRLAPTLLAGMLLAAALMTYFAGRTLPLILIGFLAYLFVLSRAVLRRVWRGIVAAIAIGVLLVAPMFIEIARIPGAEKRTEVVGGPLIAATRGDLRPALDTALSTLGMFTFAGDPESLYNIPHRPVFDGLTGALFYLGTLLCLIRLKRIESGFALVWLIAGLAPAFVSLPAASFSHTIAAQPVVYMLAALGLVKAVDKVGKRQVLLASLSLIALNALLTMRDYFGAWANDPFVRFQYHGPTRDIARWLDQNPDVTSIAIGTHPNQLWLDPLALSLDLVRDDVKARWFNPESALVYPADGLIVISPMQPPGADIAELLKAIERDRRSTDTLNVYIPGRLTDLPVPASISDGTLALLRWGPGLSRPVHPGAAVTRWTTWQVLNQNPAPGLKLFAHLLKAQHEVVAADDRTDVNSATLYPGDRLIQFNRLSLPTDLAPGEYEVEVGWYQPDTGERLRLPDGADRLLLDPIEVSVP